jgi:hypothetical protein
MNFTGNITEVVSNNLWFGFTASQSKPLLVGPLVANTYSGATFG